MKRGAESAPAGVWSVPSQDPIPVIDALITAVRNGELDEAVKALDRPRFKKKAA